MDVMSDQLEDNRLDSAVGIMHSGQRKQVLLELSATVWLHGYSIQRRYCLLRRVQGAWTGPGPFGLGYRLAVVELWLSFG